MTLGFNIHTDTCYGCKTCSIGCQNEKALSSKVFLRRVREIEGDRPGIAFVSMGCNHCDEPACVAVCPVSAYTKFENGLVVQDHDKCIGCQACIAACPFHAPAFDEDEGHTYKCDGCYGRVERGEAPLCTVVCPGANIDFGEFESFEGEGVKGVVATLPNLCVQLDPDLAIDTFADIDHSGTTDRGCEYANANL